MKYLLKVKVQDPATGEKKEYEYTVSFFRENNDYGNGFFAHFHCDENEFNKYVDLRYDKTFSPEKEGLWIAQYAFNYWTGRNRSAELLKIEIVILQ